LPPGTVVSTAKASDNIAPNSGAKAEATPTLNWRSRSPN
jgi:hypothetical protein